MSRRKRTVLLTGGSGVLGHALIDELADDFNLVCLRHRKPITDRRISDQFAGNLQHPTLGLTAAEYQRLAWRVDAIVHSAAAAPWTEQPDRIRAVNIAGSAVLARFAEQASAPLYYLSTAFIANPPDPQRSPAAAAYVQSKLDAEQLIRKHGGDAVIVRPSIVSGSTIDGRMSAFPGVHRVLGDVVRGHVPAAACDAASLMDMVPQDVVAAAVGVLLRERVILGEFWLTAADNALQAGEVLELCGEVSREAGIEAPAPRFVTPDALPPRAQGQHSVRDFLDLVAPFVTPDPLPTSVAEFALADRMTRPALRAAAAKTVRYWAATEGLVARRKGTQAHGSGPQLPLEVSCRSLR